MKAMQRRKLILLAIILLIPMLLTVLAEVTAQGPLPTLTPMAYLPIISRQGPTEITPTFTPTATPTDTPTATPTDTPMVDSYEPDDTSEQANWIQSGETQTHSIVPETDSDWVKFSINVESETVIEASDEAGDLELRLYDLNLNELGYSYSEINRPAQIDRMCGSGKNPLTPGLYYARVEHWLNSSEIPNYDITLSIQECPSAVVLMNQSVYTSSNALYVVGEVQNNGDLGITEPRIVLNLFDNGDQLIDTAIASIYYSQYSWKSALQPGDKTCFLAAFGEIAGWSYYEFETPTYYDTGDTLQNMTVYGDNGTYNSDNGSYRIVGFVRNDNTFAVDTVKIVATLYNMTGDAVGCGYQYANNMNLSPGQSTSFEIAFSGYSRDYADVDSYRLQVDGDANLP